MDKKKILSAFYKAIEKKDKDAALVIFNANKEILKEYPEILSKFFKVFDLKPEDLNLINKKKILSAFYKAIEKKDKDAALVIFNANKEILKEYPGILLRFFKVFDLKPEDLNLFDFEENYLNAFLIRDYVSNLKDRLPYTIEKTLSEKNKSLFIHYIESLIKYVGYGIVQSEPLHSLYIKTASDLLKNFKELINQGDLKKAYEELIPSSYGYNPIILTNEPYIALQLIELFGDPKTTKFNLPLSKLTPELIKKYISLTNNRFPVQTERSIALNPDLFKLYIEELKKINPNFVDRVYKELSLTNKQEEREIIDAYFRGDKDTLRKFDKEKVILNPNVAILPYLILDMEDIDPGDAAIVKRLYENGKIEESLYKKFIQRTGMEDKIKEGEKKLPYLKTISFDKTDPLDKIPEEAFAKYKEERVPEKRELYQTNDLFYDIANLKERNLKIEKLIANPSFYIPSSLSIAYLRRMNQLNIPITLDEFEPLIKVVIDSGNLNDIYILAQIMQKEDMQEFLEVNRYKILGIIRSTSLPFDQQEAHIKRIFVEVGGFPPEEFGIKKEEVKPTKEKESTPAKEKKEKIPDVSKELEDVKTKIEDYFKKDKKAAIVLFAAELNKSLEEEPVEDLPTTSVIE